MKSINLKIIALLSITLIFANAHVMQAQVLQGNGILSLEWNVSGDMLATANSDGTISVWNQNGELIHTWIGHASKTNDIDWSPNGHLLASGGDDGLIKIWETVNWGLVASMETPNDPVLMLDWNPTQFDNQLASLGLMSVPNVRIWDTNNWTLIDRLPVGTASSISWDNSGEQLATGGNPLVMIWNGSSYTPVSQHDNHHGQVYAVAWNGNDRQIASGGADGDIMIWDTINGSSARILTQLGQRVWDLQYSVDDTRIAIALDGSVNVYDVNTGGMLEIANSSQTYTAVAWSPDGNSLAYGGLDASADIAPIIIPAPQVTDLSVDSLTLTNTETIDIAHNDISIRTVDWSPDGVLLARASQNGVIEVIDTSVTPESVVFTYSDGTSPAAALSWSSSGELLAAGIGTSVHVWDFSQNNKHTILNGHTRNVISISWRNDDRELASLSEETVDNLRVWDMVTEQEHLSIGISQTYSISWNSEGENNYLSAVAGLEVRRVDPNTGEIQGLESQGGLVPALVSSISWNHNFSHLITGTILGRLVIFNPDGSFVDAFEPPNPVRINTVTWSPDNQFVASGDDKGVIRVWSINSGEQVDTIVTSEDAIFSIDWNPIENRIAYGGTDGSVNYTVPDLMMSVENLQSP